MLSLRQKLKLQDRRPSKCFLDVFTSISCFLSMMSGKGRVGYYSSRNSSLTLGAMQAVHWWSFVCSSLLVVLLRKLRRECSLSGPSAGITGMYWWNLSNGLIIYINQWHFIQNKQSMWWCGLKRNSLDSPCHGKSKTSIHRAICFSPPPGDLIFKLHWSWETDVSSSCWKW